MYSSYQVIKLAHEQFVRDSLEKVRQDSIKLADEEKKERFEAERFSNFQSKLSFKNILDLLSHYDNISYANKCGMFLLYKEVEQDGDILCEEYCYGWDAEKGKKTEGTGYEIIAKSIHACYFKYEGFSSSHAELTFKSQEDAEVFIKKALDYGLLIHEVDNCYYVPKTKLSNGSIKVRQLEWEGDNTPIYAISNPYQRNGWWVISIGIDF